MAEKEQAARHTFLGQLPRNEVRAQTLIFLLATFTIFGGFSYAFYFGSPWGVIAAIPAVVVPAITQIARRRSNQ